MSARKKQHLDIPDEHLDHGYNTTYVDTKNHDMDSNSEQGEFLGEMGLTTTHHQATEDQPKWMQRQHAKNEYERMVVERKRKRDMSNLIMDQSGDCYRISTIDKRS